MKRSYLTVNPVKFFLMVRNERLCPFLNERNMTYKVHHTDRQPFFVACEEEPDSGDAERTCQREHCSHEKTDGLREDEKKHGKKPEPEMTEDMRHGIEDDG